MERMKCGSVVNHVPCIFNPFVWRKGREGNRMEGNGRGEEKSVKELQEFPLSGSGLLDHENSIRNWIGSNLLIRCIFHLFK